MPNPRNYMFQFRSSPVPAVVDLFAKVTIGAVGAPTLDAVHSLGVTSIARVDVGQYLITLDKKYQRLLAVLDSHEAASGLSGAPDMAVVIDAVASLGKITIQFSNAGVKTDPSNSEVIKLNIILKNTSVAIG